MIDRGFTWPVGLALDGFRYGRIANGPTDAKSRIAWLNQQQPRLLGLRSDSITGGPTDAVTRIAWLDEMRPDFRPQPWEYLIKVLREMGHMTDADDVAIAKQLAMRTAGQISGFWRNLRYDVYGWLTGYRYERIDDGPTFTKRRAGPISGFWRKLGYDVYGRLTGYRYERIDDGPTLAKRRAGPISGFWRKLWHHAYGWSSGFGYRPGRLLGCMVAVWMLCALAFYQGRASGLMGPSDAIILSHPDLSQCGPPGDPGAQSWTSAACPMPAEYTTFQPALYSLDLILPLVDLQQEADWAPIVTTSAGQALGWGHALRILMWFEILFGWFFSLMLVAILSRLVQKEKD